MSDSGLTRYRRLFFERWVGLRLSAQGRAFQYAEIMALRKFLPHFAVDCVIDVGANAGQYARMLRRDTGFAGTILSFEPNPAVFPALERAAAGDDRWHVFNMALSDSNGTAAFNVMAANQFSSLNRPVEGQDPIFTSRNKVERTVEVECCTLAGLWPELTARHGVRRPLLKMDTQGHDRAVCIGAGEVLGQMLGVQTELAVRPIYAGATTYQDMIAFLAERGFAPSAFFANNKGHFPLLVEMDGLFVRSDLAAGGND